VNSTGWQISGAADPDMNLPYDISHNAVPNRILEGFIKEGDTVASSSIQHEVDGASSRTVIAFLPIL